MQPGSIFPYASSRIPFIEHSTSDRFFLLIAGCTALRVEVMLVLLLEGILWSGARGARGACGNH
jgi:hypothetical protein